MVAEYGGIVTGDNPRKSSARKRPAEYEKFDEAMRKLIKVPKRELDEAVKRDKERRSRKGG